jgi:hypothetical protein
MPRIPWALVVATAISTIGTSGLARAEASVAFLIQQLKTNDDYRVRTQAALALGNTGADEAVAPLCGALADGSVAVNVASAAALGKLSKPASLPCLKEALAKATAPSLRAQLEKAVSAVQQTTTTGPATTDAIGPDTKYYVAIQIANKTGRSGAEIEALVRSTARSKILATKGYAVAPKEETPAQGGQLVRSKKVQGFFLIVTVDPPVYAGSDLTQAIRVSMWTYPDKTLQGEVAPKLTQSDTKKGDVQSENELVKMCVETAVDSFKKIAASM